MNSDSSNKDSKPEVLNSAFRLAQIIKEDPDSLDTATWSKGDDFLVIFNDSELKQKTEDLVELKIKVIQQAIEDLSERGNILSEASMGLIFYDNQAQAFISHYKEAPLGKIVFKIGIKDTNAFIEWRKGATDQITEDDINAAIYRLTALWAEFI